MSFDRMIEKIVETQNPTVAGLDPKLAYIPSYILDGAVAKYGKTLEAAAAALLEYNKGLIDALCDIVPAVKPQAAYYEMYGWQGVRTLAETVAYARAKGMFVITDGKRNDIGTTMEAYATAHLGETDVFGEKTEAFGADALTVNGGVGAVVGATYPAQLGEMREKAPHTFFLVPGYGAQGGGADDVAPAFDKNGLGAIINSSRGIMCAWQKEKCDEHDYAQAARREAIRMRDEICARIGEIRANG